MERGEKVAYYCSELGARQTNEDPQQQTLVTNSSKSTNMITTNNNNIIGRYDSQNDKLDDYQTPMTNNQQDGQAPNGADDYPSRIISSRFNAATHSDQVQQMVEHQSQGTRQQFMQGQVVGATPQQAQSMSAQQQSTTSQPQYLISSGNPQYLTNLNPHLFNTGKNLPFPNQPHSMSYHINSNHIYQGGAQQQAQARATLLHHKSPSQGEDGHSKLLGKQVILSAAEQAELQRRQQFVAQQQLNGEHANLTTSQSMTQNDFNRLRRKSDNVGMGLTSEVGLESLNLDFEAMLMNDGQGSVVNSNQLLQKQRPNSGQNINQILRSLANQKGPNGEMNNCDRSNANGSDLSSTGYGRPSQMHDPDGQFRNKDVSSIDNRSEDNIYEEIGSHSDTWKKKNSKKFIGASFTRWFSTRKKSSNSQNSDQEDNPYAGSKTLKRPRLISLPDTVPDDLTPEKLKRRLIVGSIVDSENSYTMSLYRLIYEYKKPLDEAEPPILSPNKVKIIFYNLDQISQFHRLFGLALMQHVQEWDEKEMIGSVFTSQFSNPIVLDIYSGFINNFTNAMETARRASKSKAFAQFLHDKSVSSPDRLSFFGSMVKPVQRFPQFILLLSDLLKHTPFNHPDRMNLQRALTELESLADRLNERKRDAERHFAVKQLLKDHLNESNTHPQRFLLRQDDTCLLDMDPGTNTILKSKTRKMYLLNDMLICVSTPSNRLKFAVPLTDISIIENITPVISNLLAHSKFKNLNENPNAPPSPQNYTIERMECERQSLVHDLELMMRITGLVAALRFQYNGLNPSAPEQICLGIREEIRKKEFQMTLIDRSCLQLRLHSKNNKDTLVVQFGTPESKRDWLIDLRLTKLALDRANNPGWENVTDNPPPTYQASLCSIGQRVPLFVKSLAIFKSEQSHLTCALHYYLRQAPFIGENPAGVLWICNVNASASSLGALATNGAEVSLIHSYELSDSHVTCLESVGSTLWIGLRQGRIIVIDANSPSEWIQFASLDVQSEVTCIKYFGNFVYVGLISGIVAVFDAINFDKPYLIQLSQSPVTFLLPINDEMFACSNNRIWRIKETNIVDSFTVQNNSSSSGIIIPLEDEPRPLMAPQEEEPRPNLLAHCGSGIWVSLLDSPIVKLYHAETLKHLVDIDVGSSIRRVLNDFKEEIKITVTSMMATRGLLWIGTNVGMIATLTLPRLQGVPLLSGSVNVALHRFLGPVNILLNLSAGSECVPQLPFNNRDQQQMRPNHLLKSEEVEAIYGQYADLMNVGDYIMSSGKVGNMASGEMPVDRMAWEFSNVNISGMNVSDDSGSSASSGAIYQDGVPRGIKQVQNNAIISNSGNMGNAQVAMSNQAIQGNQHQMVAGQLMTASGNLSGQQLSAQQQVNQINDLNHIYDKAQTQQVAYNQGSLNGGVPPMPQGLSGEAAMDQMQQQQQHQMLSASQTQLANKNVTDINNSQADYGSKSGTVPNKLYDQPTQLIQQHQQIVQQFRQSSNQVDGSMMNSMHASQASGYGSLQGVGPSKTKSSYLGGNKTVLVLAGGNGYQRIATNHDNKPFGEHAHCIVWEYKA